MDSNFLIQMTPCVTSHMHPDLPAIMVFIEYLCALEVTLFFFFFFFGLFCSNLVLFHSSGSHVAPD